MYPASATPASAASNFIQTYIDANGGCTGDGPLTFVLVGGGLQAPFGKAAGDWSEEDLALLRPTLDACAAAVSRTGNPYKSAEFRNDASKLMLRVPPIVQQGHAANEANARQVDARREIAQGRLDKAVQAKGQVRASADAEVDQLAREAAAAELELRQAQAEANARVAQLSRRRDAAQGAAQGIRDGSTLNQAPMELREANAGRPNAAQVPDTATANLGSNALLCKTAEQLAAAPPPPPGLTPGCIRLPGGSMVMIRKADQSSTDTDVLCVRSGAASTCLWTRADTLRR